MNPALWMAEPRRRAGDSTQVSPVTFVYCLPPTLTCWNKNFIMLSVLRLKKLKYLSPYRPLKFAGPVPEVHVFGRALL